MKALHKAAALLLAALAAGAGAAETCPDPSAPRGAVMAYLRAMHENRFEDAYDYVTENMTDGRSRTAWAELQRSLYLPGAVDIYGVDIRNAYAPADDPQCSAGATVANVLSSRDRLNEAGNVEFEIYRVVAADARWRIDSQETLFDDTAIRRWFPAAGSYETSPQ